MKLGFKPKLGYEHPGLGDDREIVDWYKTAELATAKWVGALLDRVYPGHAWHVRVQITSHSGRRPTGGLIMIRLNGLMPANHCYRVQLSETLVENSGKAAVLKGAGEILERYNIPRTGFMLDHWRNAMNAMPIAARRLGRGHVAPLLD